jgi:hypothetical protein
MIPSSPAKHPDTLDEATSLPALQAKRKGTDTKENAKGPCACCVNDLKQVVENTDQSAQSIMGATQNLRSRRSIAALMAQLVCAVHA